jgi:hypothetical protein
MTGIGATSNMHWTDSNKSGTIETLSYTFHILPKLQAETYTKAGIHIVALRPNRS